MFETLRNPATRKAHAPDYLILLCVGLLVLFGIFILASASSNLGITQFGDAYYYLKHQVYYGLSLGLIGFFVAAKLYYGVYSKRAVSVTLLLLTILFLLMVFTPLGLTTNGATRWLNLGPFSFQPAELLKVTLLVYLASWLAFKDHRHQSWKEGLLPFAAVLAIVSSILVLQHSTSPVVMLIAVALVMYFMSGAKLQYLGAIVGVGVLSIALIVLITPYRTARVLSYLNPEADASGGGYHLLQAKTAIGSGGLGGVGYGQSSIKYRLPEAIGDSIFAVAGEEFGFVGGVFILGLFMTLVTRMLFIARKLADPFGRLLLIGFASIITLQVVVNVGAMTGLLPLTGTTLPFISYGGTNLAVFLAMMGIVVNISKHTSK